MTDLASRRARIARINAKRPPLVLVDREPEAGSREALVDVLFDLLDRVVNNRQG